MLSDIVCAGARHIRKSTIGGSTATATRVIQAVTEVTSTKKATAHQASTQTATMAVLMC